MRTAIRWEAWESTSPYRCSAPSACLDKPTALWKDPGSSFGVLGNIEHPIYRTDRIWSRHAFDHPGARRGRSSGIQADGGMPGMQRLPPANLRVRLGRHQRSWSAAAPAAAHPSDDADGRLNLHFVGMMQCRPAELGRRLEALR